MSICEKSGKDKVVFITKEDFDKPSKLELKVLPPDEQNHGLILPNGEINFNCPCLGNMASGPCAFEFREAFSCFHYSQSEHKGSECVDKFIEMQNCVAKFPNLYASENAAMNQEPDMKEFTETSSVNPMENNEEKTVA